MYGKYLAWVCLSRGDNRETGIFIFPSFINKMKMHITFQEGDRGRQRAAKQESWPAIGEFEPATMSKRHHLIRWATAGRTKGLSESVLTHKIYASECSRLGIAAGFNPPMCKGKLPPEAKPFLITLVPAPTKSCFRGNLAHPSTWEMYYWKLIRGFVLFLLDKRRASDDSFF